MVRTQIYLTDEQKLRLERLAAASGKRQSEVIREALDAYLAARGAQDWKEAFAAVRGMWAGRDGSTILSGACAPSGRDLSSVPTADDRVCARHLRDHR